MTLLATTAPTALWYLSRGTGAVALMLLTASVVFGVADRNRWSSRAWPRFVVDAVHRSVSLFVLVVIAAHVLVTVLDGFAPISLLDGIVPFRSPYRPLWLGLGTLALDLLVALAVTSVLRERIGFRAWRAVHWLAYACWPVAVAHGLGTGTDASQTWMLVLTGLCVLAVLVVVWTRLTAGWPQRAGLRLAGMGMLLAFPVALAVWLPQGPLARGWARRAGTPARLTAATIKAPVGSPVRAAARPPAFPAPFDAHLSGTVRSHRLANGLVEIDLAMRTDTGPPGRLLVEIMGEPDAGGGVTMTDAPVYFGPPRATALYRGRVTSLDGPNIRAAVSAVHGAPLDLAVSLRIDPAGRAASGELRATRADRGTA